MIACAVSKWSVVAWHVSRRLRWQMFGRRCGKVESAKGTIAVVEQFYVVADVFFCI